jgi:hypothetical protein
LVEFNRASVEFNQASVEFNQASVEFNQASVEFNQTSVEFNQASVEFNQASVEFNQTSVEFNQTSVELNQTSVLRIESVHRFHAPVARRHDINAPFTERDELFVRVLPTGISKSSVSVIFPFAVVAFKEVINHAGRTVAAGFVVQSGN